MFHVRIPVETTRSRTGVTAPGDRAWWPEAVGALAAILLAVFMPRGEPSPDVAWQLWVAHQLRMGARFYVDVVDTNPPLWFWMAVPIDWAADRIGAGSGAVMVHAVGLISALSIVATGRLMPAMSASARAALLTYAAMVLMLMPLSDMGQREQLTLIGMLPYLALVAARHENRTIPAGLAFAVGVGAAPGLAFKHYFMGVPLLIELWLLCGRRRDYRLLRPELVALGAMALLYAVAVMTLAPRFLSDIVPTLRLLYHTFDSPSFSGMIRITQYFWVVLLALLLMRPRLLGGTPLAAVMTIAAAGFASSWLIQFKGWPYHAIPTTGCLMMGLAVLFVQRWDRLSPLAKVAVPTALALPLALAGMVGPYRDAREPAMRAVLAGLGPRDGVAIASPDAALAWPMTLRRGAPYPSRYNGNWTFAAIVRDHGCTPALVRLGHRVAAETAQDYRCAQPVRILFDTRQDSGTDAERYFFGDPGFAALMRHYRHRGHYGYLDIYQRIAPFPMPPTASCRRNA